MTKKVLVFGVFDNLHPGHHHFLKQARALGDELAVVVARDDVTMMLKKRSPLQHENDRLAAVRGVEGVKDVFLGDATLGTYGVVRVYEPSHICLGYDQGALEADLREKIQSGFLPGIVLSKATAYRPEEFHSSLMRDDNVSA